MHEFPDLNFVRHSFLQPATLIFGKISQRFAVDLDGLDHHFAVDYATDFLHNTEATVPDLSSDSVLRFRPNGLELVVWLRRPF